MVPDMCAFSRPSHVQLLIRLHTNASRHCRNKGGAPLPSFVDIELQGDNHKHSFLWMCTKIEQDVASLGGWGQVTNVCIEGLAPVGSGLRS